MTATHLSMGDRRFAQILPTPRVKRAKALDGQGIKRDSDPMARYCVHYDRSGANGFADPLDRHLTFDTVNSLFGWFARQ